MGSRKQEIKGHRMEKHLVKADEQTSPNELSATYQGSGSPPLLDPMLFLLNRDLGWRKGHK